MKILALDIGDRWIGSAISDALGIAAKPLQTVQIDDLESFLKKIFIEETIKAVVVGLPKTLRGTSSDQTKKTISEKEKLEKIFPDKEWVLWDEKLTSKYAAKLKKVTTKEEKIKSHSVAAAFILQTYLDHLQFKKSMLNQYE